MSFSRSWKKAQHEDTQRRSEMGGGSRNRRFGLMWKLDETPTKVHFMLPEKMYRHPTSEGEFPFRAGCRYWIPWGGKNRKGTYLEVGEKCLVDVYKNPGKFGLSIDPLKKLRELRPQIYYSTAAWIEEEFHLVEKQNSSGDGTYRERERCTKLGCPHCASKWPKVFGRKVYLDINMSHWNQTIYDIQERVSSNCKCGGFIYTSHYTCEKCENSLVDFANRCFSCSSNEVSINIDDAEAACRKCGATWSLYEVDNPEIRKVVNDDIVCPKCKHKGLPIPVQNCTTKNCPKDPYSIYDCQMKMQLVSGPSGKNKELRIDDVRVQPPDPKLFNPAYQGVGKEDGEKGAAFMTRPIDLDKMLAPLDIDEEALAIGLANPFSTASKSAGYAQYQAEEPVEQPRGPQFSRSQPVPDEDIPF